MTGCRLSVVSSSLAGRKEESASIMFSLRVVEIAIKVSNIKCFVFDLGRMSVEQGLQRVKMAMVGSRLFLPHLHRQIGLKKTVFIYYQVLRGDYA